MSRLPLALAPLLAGCEVLLPYLEEQRTEASYVYWTGTVLDGPYADDAGVFSGGAITLTDLGGQGLLNAQGEPLDEPYEVEGSEGSWVLTVPTSTEVLLRLSGDGFVNTVWAAETPSGRAYWFTGALFARRAEDVSETLSELAGGGVLGGGPADLSEGERVHLWAEPLYPERWVGASYAVVDAEGLGEVLPFTVDDDGTVRAAGAEDPVDLILAVDLAPGDITFEAATPDGSHVLLAWPAQGGDLLNASFLELSGDP